MKHLVLFIFLTTIFISPTFSQEKPNIILIMADDLGYECIGANGGTSYKTPHLDALAKNGARFSNCFATPLCTPSRVQIMTGRYNFRNYVRFGELDLKEKTFAHVLKAAGYGTCIAGKWQLAGGLEGPNKAGFDQYCVWQIEEGGKGSRYRNPKLIENGKNVTETDGKYGPDMLREFIFNYMEKNKAQPFFIYYPMVLPHNPFEPTPLSSDWGTSKKSDPKYFADMVNYMDKEVGEIVARVEKLGLSNRTLIIYTGDNGTNPAITSKMGDRQIKGDKGALTDAGTHVPLIAHWPTKISSKVSDDLVDFSDVLPTLAAAANASLPEGVKIDGKSFLPQLLGQASSPREWIFCHYNPLHKGVGHHKGRFARDTRWKLYDQNRFFDMKNDPEEKSPLASVQDSEALAAQKKLQAVLDSMTAQGSKIE
jgi:arylsulfatase A